MRDSSHRRRGRDDAPDAMSPVPHDVHELHGAGHRHARLQQILHEELAALLRDEVSDPALDGVTVTSVELSVDYRNARVRFAAAPDARPAAVRALDRAQGFFRARLVDALDLKFVPKLRFVPATDALPDDLG